MIGEKFPTCNICGMEIISDADYKGQNEKYCKLCGIPTETRTGFCCEKCEKIFRCYVKTKKDKEMLRWTN